MNKNNHCLIFNASRCCMMAVLETANQLNLLSAQNTASSLGVSYSAVGGFGVNASASKGSGNGSDTSCTNTNVIGAVVAANTIQANIGGNLNIQSLQDLSTYSSSQSSAGSFVSATRHNLGSSLRRSNARLLQRRKKQSKAIAMGNTVFTTPGGFIPIPNKSDNFVASPCRAVALSAASRLILTSIGNWNYLCKQSFTNFVKHIHYWVDRAANLQLVHGADTQKVSAVATSVSCW